VFGVSISSHPENKMIADHDYQSISATLTELGFFTDQTYPDVLKVIKPGGNKGLWITQFKDDWYVGTFISVAYQIPTTNDIGPLCKECLDSEEFINVAIPKQLVEKFLLRLLSPEEFLAFGT
jgi:hypothetical protein